ncbi:hypothetical protein [Rhizorhapis sp.]|uniref:hypothetical protein n=1 Tax=Rhizorhapis sp. TaxID=1968842 RepID=UPI002B49CE62|nr:hypothetical protein [Rhizorhapis sp.]HKR17712.1 hypothetical protein [Rhizorhapis sp.]
MSIVSTTSMETVIHRAIQAAIEEEISAEEERAIQRVREKIRAQKATIAMALMKHFDVARGIDHIVITVRDTVGEGK